MVGIKNPVMYAIAYRYESETWVNFVTEDDEMNLSFENILPSKTMADNYVQDILSNEYIVVPVTIVSYKNGTTVMEYTDPWH